MKRSRFAMLAPVAAAVLLTGCGSNPVEQDVAQVAADLGATGFTYCGESSAMPGVAGGTAWLNGELIGIDIFTSGAVETEWLQLAEPLGVAPITSGPDWVAYPSVYPHCS